MTDSNPINRQDEANSGEIVIHVRDRRKPKQFIVDNLIMDEYFPLVGATGYSIYSLLVRMSNERDGEQARASLRMMCSHLSIESRSALGYYITLMEILGILFKDLPEAIIMQNGRQVKKKMGNRTNYYYILDVKPVTPERLKAFKTAVQANEVFNDTYRTLFLKNIEDWRPIQSHWRRPGKKIKTVVGQDSLPLDFGQDENTAPPSTATMQDADPKSLEILRRIEITRPSLLQELGQHKPSDILALVWYGQTQSWMEDDRLSGYIIKNLGNDGAPAPKGFHQLASFWLQADEENREELKDCHLYGNHPSNITQDFAVPLAAAKAALKLSSPHPAKNYFLIWLDI